MSIENSVLTVPKEELTPEHFRKLLEGGPQGLDAIILPGFISEEERLHTIQWLRELPRRDYPNDVRGPDGKIVETVSFGVDRPEALEPYNSTFDTPPNSPERRRYAALVDPMMEIYEKRSRPFSWIGHTMLALVNRLRGYPYAGAERAILEGQEALLGLPRFTLPEITKLQDEPHIDVMPPEIAQRLGRSAVMFSMNVYYLTPDDAADGGGDLLTYPKGVDEPPIRITPRPGDAVIIRTSDKHAVATYRKGERWSIQVFGAVGSNPEKPVYMWN